MEGGETAEVPLLEMHDMADFFQPKKKAFLIMHLYGFKKKKK